MTSDRGRSIDRFVTFADAVVAIAITLLAIPVLEHADAAREGLAAWWAVSAYPLLGLAISFAVIARQWWSHHRIFEHVERWSGALVVVIFAWLLSIVLLSIATAVTTQGNSPDGATWAFPLYLSVMVVSSGLLFVQAWIVHRHRELSDDSDADWRGIAGSLSVTVSFALVLVVGTLLPRVNYGAFLLMGLTGPIARLVTRRLESRSTARSRDV